MSSILNQPDAPPNVNSINGRERLIADSAAMQNVLRSIHAVAGMQEPVLLIGEIGTGKKRIARAIYELGGIEGRPWITVNCATESAEVIEQRIFGNEDRASLIQANQGCLLLEEVDRLSETGQLRLLQFLKEGRFQRPAALRWENVNVRVIASSHLDLRKEVAEGRFREDLYWSLNTLPIEIPPLRHRRDDIVPLAEQMIQMAAKATGHSPIKVPTDVSKLMREYSFPGNLLELRACMLRAVLLAEGDKLTQSLLPAAITGEVKDAQSVVFRPTDDGALLRELVHSQLSKTSASQTDLYEQIVGPLEKELMIQVLDLCNQVQVKAAKRLGINRNTLKKKLDDFGLSKSKNDDRQD